MRRFFGTITTWLYQREPVMLLWALCLIVGLSAFTALAIEVQEGDTQSFDTFVIKSLRTPTDPNISIGPKWLKELGRDVTALGGSAALVLLTFAAGGYLWLNRRYRLLVFLLSSITSGGTIMLLLKKLFSRPRPDIVPHFTQIYTSSFPSGHSMMSGLVYLTLGTIIASATTDKRTKIYVLSWAFLLAFLVGVSRVYLGVHYPTDVLAGWIAGLLWAIFSWFMAQQFLSLSNEAKSPSL
ncbi:MAG: phosphoesterase [Deltaproteobacteria bacterium]|nr:phosphoesterase [Deltaproteobacteria bacterium]|tara:strand:- start:1753 stop:2469 length:717 start_codon:yes stop_codon:yes gene_type:complete